MWFIIYKSDKNNKDAVILLLINLIFIASVFYGGQQMLLDRGWIFLIILAITVLNTVILFFDMRYQKNIGRMINKVNTKLKEIVENKKLNLTSINTDGDMLPFFDNLKRLNAWVMTKQSSYDDILKIVNSIAINVHLDKLLDSILPKLLETTDSSCGAVYLVNNANNKLMLKTSVGFSKNIYSEFDLSTEEGFFGFSPQ
ncbi:MAG: hypothetical protein LBV08_06115, partial [Clostridiales bacterium]|nr:hypothetical protein [Clostridiales bacterium]